MLEGEYKAVCLDKYNGRVHMINKSFRSLQLKEILVKIHYATIHPFDILFMRGQYGEIEPTKFPMIPGFEGSGEIVAVSDLAEKHLIGRRVSCFANSNKEGYFEGVWAEYFYTTYENIILYDKFVPYERICFLINPLISVGLLDTIKKSKSESALQDAADTPVGKMLINLCQKENIHLINIMKNFTHVNDLINIGASNLVGLDHNWELECKKLCNLLNTTIAFDTVGGDMTGKVLNLLPEDSTLYHYGNLSENDISKVISNDFIFQGKTLTGFWMIRWLRSLSAEEYEYWWDYIKNELQSLGRTFKTNINKVFPLQDFDDAIKYYLNNRAEDYTIVFRVAPYTVESTSTSGSFNTVTENYSL
jgi:NADPH:quinone reductase